MRPWFLGLAFVVLGAGSIGTPEDPELLDLTGDVEYLPTYLGPRDHDQADIESLWIDFDNIADTIAFHLQVPGTRRLENLGPEFSYSCTVGFNMTVDGAFNGRMRGRWAWSATNQSESTSFFYQREADETPTATAEDLPHQFQLILGEPGFYVWRVDRASVQLRGQEIRDIGADCNADQSMPVATFSVTRGAVGFDTGVGHGSYVVDGLLPAEPEPSEEPTQEATVTSSSWTSDVGATSAVGVVLAATVLLSTAVWRRKT